MNYLKKYFQLLSNKDLKRLNNGAFTSGDGLSATTG